MTDLGGGTTDAVVVGGGIQGCAVARAAALAGLSVTVVERGRPGHEATWAAAGMLSPFGEAESPGPFFRLTVESLRRYPDFVRAVESEAGCPVDLLRSGKLEVALDEQGEERLRRRSGWLEEEDVRLRWLGPGQVREMEPALSPGVRGALLLQEEAQVDNRLLGPALARAARAAGVRIVEDATVLEILRGGGRTEGVRIEGGATIRSPRVVVCAGAWSGGLEGLPRPLPVRPVRGQMLSLSPPIGTLGRVVASPRVYLVPRREGPLVVGSTMEEEGFRKHTTARAQAGLLEAAMEAAPALANAPLIESWAGLRPATPDGLPVLGPDPEIEGLFYATGHFRNGILLAPVTADSLAPLLSGEGDPPVDLGPFGAGRFAPEEDSSSPS